MQRIALKIAPAVDGGDHLKSGGGRCEQLFVALDCALGGQSVRLRNRLVYQLGETTVRLETSATDFVFLAEHRFSLDYLWTSGSPTAKAEKIGHDHFC